MSAPPEAARFVVGIDLGTTNSAVAWAEPARGAQIEPLAIAQLVAEGEVAERDTLPSALYLAGEHDVPAGALALPWREDQRFVVGTLARRLGTRVAGRLVTSAKSWLCHGGVDRTAAILPWGGAPEVLRLSPVAASARILEHIRDVWDAWHRDDPLATQDVVLTVPASFDEVARELTVRAAREAGLSRLRLLEEPQAAIYAWIAAHDDWRDRLAGRGSILVVDVGGGTTDFSLIAVRRGPEGLGLDRVAVGEHLLLGGDNMDMALARLVASRHAEAAALDAARWQQLVALCREAKERLLGEDPPASVALSLAGRGRGVVRGSVAAELGREEALAAVADGFFASVEREARPREQPGLALAELGLPFAADPEITRHLAEFLARAGDGAGGAPLARWDSAPQAVLFNGGAMKPALLRGRVLSTLERWAGTRPVEIEGSDLDLAVARGAVAYGLALRGLGARIGGGAARAYYVGLAREPGAPAAAPDAAAQESAPGVGASAAPARRLLCIAPLGMEEGDAIEIRSPEFELLANAPVHFPICASTERREDTGGAVIEADPAALHELPPLSAVLRFGRSLQARSIPVHLRVELTETGTLDLWCHSRTTDHRWRLSFDLRGAATSTGGATAKAAPARAAEEARGGAGSEPEGASEVGARSAARATDLVIAPERIAAARARIESCFGAGPGGVDPVRLVRDLEELLGAGKDAWPLACIRQLWDALLPLEGARARTPAHEARWLNLAGFLLRPGFGEVRDTWRAEQVWRLFDRGLLAPGAAQVRAEWWSLWKRVAGGLTRQQQQALYQEIRPLLLPDVRKKARPGRWKAGPQELREMWQVAGSLERLAAGAKLELAARLAERVQAGKASEVELWALGRLAARAPIHGPANCVIEPSRIEPWLERIADADWGQREAATALALAQMARLTGDRARDVTAALRERIAARLERRREGRALARWLRERVSIDPREQALVLAESLPVGLRLSGDVRGDDTPGP